MAALYIVSLEVESDISVTFFTYDVKVWRTLGEALRWDRSLLI